MAGIMNGILQDLRYALRQLPRVFTIVAVVERALGIGADTAVALRYE